MRRNIVWLLLVLLLPVSAATAAEDADLATVIAALETPFRQTGDDAWRIVDFTAAFSQRSAVVSIDRVQRGAGTVWFRFQPEENGMPMFRWDYHQPNEQQIISDGATLWVYLPENRQVIVSDLRQVQTEYGDNPVSFFSGLGHLEENFQIGWSDVRTDETGDYRLLLLPRRESRFFKQIEVTVSHRAVALWQQQERQMEVFPLVATQVTDPQENLTRITFIDPRWNIGTTAADFDFTVPPGVEEVSPADDLAF